MIPSLLHICSHSFLLHQLSYFYPIPFNPPPSQNNIQFPFLFVGGIVRDYILYLQNTNTAMQKISPSISLLLMNNFEEFLKSKNDIDIATTLQPKEAAKLLDNTFPNGERVRMFATNTIKYDSINIDCTSTRIDTQCDGRHAKMKFGVSYFQDSHRRDFTFNAMYLSSDGTLFDFHEGVEHLINGEIHFIGDAKTRIMEDYTRIKRYYDFSKRFNMRNKEIENAIDYIIANSKTPIIMR